MGCLRFLNGLVDGRFVFIILHIFTFSLDLFAVLGEVGLESILFFLQDLAYLLLFLQFGQLYLLLLEQFFCSKLNWHVSKPFLLLLVEDLLGLKGSLIVYLAILRNILLLNLLQRLLPHVQIDAHH